jgi:hypothetical protein
MTKKELSNKLFELYYFENYPFHYYLISNKIIQEEKIKESKKPKTLIKRLIRDKFLKNSSI